MTDGGPGCVVVIPARYASVRLPGKVLLSETGRPMIAHVVERAREAACAERVVVATDDRRIVKAAEAAGAETVLTSPHHPNGTARIAEACELLGLDASCPVINVQGDEPELDPGIIDAVAQTLVSPPGGALGASVDVATAANLFWVNMRTSGVEMEDRDVVKVVMTRGPEAEGPIRTGDVGRAIYFSRAPIPVTRGGASEGAEPLRHIGIYAYRAGFVSRYASWASTPLERSEKLEQLRVLEHSGTIAVRVVRAAPHGIDTRAQYDAFVRRQGRGAGV